jgi:hypothetical protein
MTGAAGQGKIPVERGDQGSRLRIPSEAHLGGLNQRRMNHPARPVAVRTGHAISTAPSEQAGPSRKGETRRYRLAADLYASGVWNVPA